MNDNEKQKGTKQMANNQTMYYIARKQLTNNNGFGYKNGRPMELWDGKAWTTNKDNAVKCNNNPRMRMLAARLLDAEVVTL